ncbi:MAG: hypothetical protein EON55_02760, partial [Alphaproteobacteria bacterium]
MTTRHDPQDTCSSTDTDHKDFPRMYFAPALLLTLTLQPAGKAQADPADVEVVDAIDCRLDQASYMQFAMAVAGEEQLARKRHWKKVAP